MQKKAREGDLYKILELFGAQFELYYGYYDEFERQSPFGEPIPIYPDFTREPAYTKDGIPYATQMQNVCEHYDGVYGGEECHECRYFQTGVELLGLCSCKKRHREADQPVNHS